MKLKVGDKIVISGRHIMTAAAIISLASAIGLAWLYLTGANVGLSSVFAALACAAALLYLSKKK